MLHYKMYKSGRFWVFAGILATTWQLGTFTASADAQPAATGTPDTQTVVAGTSSDSTSKETPLKQPANSAAPATNDSQAQGQPINSQSENNNDLLDKPQRVDQSSSAAPTSDGDKRVQWTGSSEAKSASERAKPIEQQSAAPVTNNNADSANLTLVQKTNQQESGPINDGAGDDVASKESATIGATKLAMIRPMSLKLAKANMLRNTQPVTPAKDYAGYQAADPDKKGLFGTSEWWIDPTGTPYTLHIGAGTLADTTYSWDYSIDGVDPETPWVDNSLKIDKIIIEDPVVAAPSVPALFANLTNLTQIEGLGLLDTSQVTDMSYMFQDDLNLTSLDVGNWDVSHVQNFRKMFLGTLNVSVLNISQWNTSSAIDMNGMFTSSGVKALDVSQWNMEKVTNNRGMFNYGAYTPGGMIAEFSLLKKLTVGSAFKFVGETERSADIGRTSRDYPYTERWINSKTHQVYDEKEISKLYDETAAGAATYEAETDEIDHSILNTFGFEIFLNDYDWDLGCGANFNNSRGNVFVIHNRSSNISYQGDVDVTKLGSYPITISYTDDIGHTIVGQPSLVTVIDPGDSQAYITSSNMTLVVGPKLTTETVNDAIENSVGGKTYGGRPMMYEETIYMMDDNSLMLDYIPTYIPGTYSIVYEYEMAPGEDQVTITSKSTLNIIKTAATVKLKPTTIIAGPDVKSCFNSSDYFAGGLDGTGQHALTAADVTFGGLDAIKFDQPGKYRITASYEDVSGNQIEAMPEYVTVIPNTAQLELQPVTMIASPNVKFDPTSVIKVGTTAFGTPMTTDNGLTITSQVDAQTAGQYLVTVSYTDASGNVITKDTKVTVENHLAIQTQAVDMMQGQAFGQTKGILSAVDSAGNAIDFAKLSYDIDAIDVNQPGTYQVKVSYTDQFGNATDATIPVTVHANEVVLKTVPVINLWLGEQLDPTQAVISTTVNGQAISKEKLSYDIQQINTGKPGTYQLGISYQNQAVQAVPVTVSAASLVVVPAVTITQGATFDVASLIKQATDAFGQTLAPTALRYSDTVDTSKVGQQRITVTNQDVFGNVLTQSVTVTVQAAAVKPTPDPEPEPEPKPDPDPEPKPNPEPTPNPKPEPTPDSELKPKPEPTPEPEPVPAPNPAPVTKSTPTVPTPEPATPVVKPQPTTPKSQPAPVAPVVKTQSATQWTTDSVQTTLVPKQRVRTHRQLAKVMPANSAISGITVNPTQKAAPTQTQSTTLPTTTEAHTELLASLLGLMMLGTGLAFSKWMTKRRQN